MQVFVDQDGTFYPKGWQTLFGEPPRRGGYSLMSIARQRGLEASLRRAEDQALDTISTFIRSKQRVFILIHGFNNDQRAAEGAYSKIQDAIAFEPGDGVISFFWDGLVASGPGPAKIWFPATGYSQLAGQNALRRILNRTVDKTVVIIAHSRGASVALSALSDPPYNTEFARATCERNRIDVTVLPRKACDLGESSVTRLPVPMDNGNRISMLFLAPAIGDVDFRSPAFYDRDCPLDNHESSCAYRSLGRQVTRIVHTVNPNDPVLAKYIQLSRLNPLSERFNPTEFGLSATATKRLQMYLPNLSYVELNDLDAHAFDRYVTHHDFPFLLRAVSVRPVDPGPAQSSSR